MFTGIIEEIGVVDKVSPISGGKRITINASAIMDGLRVDDSVSVAGVCLTAVDIAPRSFTVEAVGETLQKSTLFDCKSSVLVNLERAMKLGDRLGGHLVQGHVNGIGIVTQMKSRGENWYMEVSIPDDLKRYVVSEGSIAIDGISLTVARIKNTTIGISIIPHTFKNTTLSKIRIGYKCNIETDLIGKYLEKWYVHRSDHPGKSKMSEKWLKDIGY
jgi:riboflavin synthase